MRQSNLDLRSAPGPGSARASELELAAVLCLEHAQAVPRQPRSERESHRENAVTITKVATIPQSITASSIRSEIRQCPAGAEQCPSMENHVLQSTCIRLSAFA